LIKNIKKLFQPAPHIAILPSEYIDAKYKIIRWQTFLGIFLGYMGFYFLRNNFALAMPYLQKEGFSKATLGMIFSALPLAYGISKFVMGSISDRSNPKYFMAAGLFASVVVNFLLGTEAIFNYITLAFLLMFVNGWTQGMGWPASARVIVHWFSKKERGTKTAIWGTAVNIGGGLVAQLALLGMAIFSSWHSIFYFPAIVTLIIVFIILFTVRDTPQSEGLPPIEEYKKEEYAETNATSSTKASKNKTERELSTKEILFKYILVNKYLWFLSLANIFIYIIRYGVINWAPVYLTEIKHFNPTDSSWAYSLFEFAAIPGTLLAGWLSDQKYFSSRRTAANIIFMVFVTLGVLAYWMVPPGYKIYDYITLLSVGFLIYGPVLLVYIVAMDVVPKKAAGTAAGFCGLFGYVGGTVMANAGMGVVVDHFGWNGGFILLLASCGLTIFLLSLTLFKQTASAEKEQEATIELTGQVATEAAESSE